MIVKYALVRNGEILKFKNVPDDDTLIIGKMLAHGYLPVIEDPVPIFDYITQLCSDSYEINVDNVTRKWIVTEQQFGEAKRMKEEEIKSKAVDSIRVAFDNELHNEATLVSNTITAKTEFMAALSTAKTNMELRKIEVEFGDHKKKKAEVM